MDTINIILKETFEGMRASYYFLPPVVSLNLPPQISSEFHDLECKSSDYSRPHDQNSPTAPSLESREPSNDVFINPRVVPAEFEYYSFPLEDVWSYVSVLLVEIFERGRDVENIFSSGDLKQVSNNYWDFY